MKGIGFALTFFHNKTLQRVDRVGLACSIVLDAPRIGRDGFVAVGAEGGDIRNLRQAETCNDFAGRGGIGHEFGENFFRLRTVNRAVGHEIGQLAEKLGEDRGGGGVGLGGEEVVQDPVGDGGFAFGLSGRFLKVGTKDAVRPQDAGLVGGDSEGLDEARLQNGGKLREAGPSRLQ